MPTKTTGESLVRFHSEKYFLQNMKVTLDAKQTIHGRTLGRLVEIHDSHLTTGRPYFSSTGSSNGLVPSAIRLQAITWANADPDLCYHMASLGHNELTHWGLNKMAAMLQLATHDDIIKWKHFPRFWPFVRGSHWSPVRGIHRSPLNSLCASDAEHWCFLWSVPE